jgi:tetratricopeptide (TPR) repeat protein
MKKIVILSLCLFCLIINLSVPGEPVETQSPWKQLKNKLRGMRLIFFNDASTADKYIPCPSTLPAVNLPEIKEYFIKTEEIQSALESAGIKEPVIIVLNRIPGKRSVGKTPVSNFQKELSVTLGTYTPIVDINTKKKAVTWSLPKFKSIKIPRAVLRMLILERVTKNVPLLTSEKGILAFKNTTNDIKAEIEVIFQFPFDYEKYEYGQLDQYLVKGNIQKAKKYCSKLGGCVQRECYHILADALFRQDIKKSITRGAHEAIENYCQKQEGELQKQCYWITADAYFCRKEFEKAIQNYEKAGFKESSNRIGEIYFILGEYKKAVAYFEKGDHSARRANAYGALADFYKKQGEKALAKKYYKKAVLEYEWMIKSYDYRWNDADKTDRLRCRNILDTFEKNAEEIAHQQKIKKILEKTAAYCHRLDTALIHFFCKEVISENSHSRYGTIKKTFVYEYQLIKESDKTIERRIQLKLNGARTRKEEVPLGTTAYKYKYLIYGPIAFFKKSQQQYFDYKIVKEEMFNNQRAIVIEAIPLRIVLSTKSLCGKIWLDADDENFAILKIEWHPKFLIENFDESLENAKRHNFTLKVDYFSEFGIEKNGFRFPSRYMLKEYHINKKGKEKCKTSIDIIFKDYRFFTVGTEVTYH